MVKILHIIPRISYSGGTENFVRTLLYNWDRKDDKNIICTFYYDNNAVLKSDLEKRGILIIPITAVWFESIQNHYLQFIVKNSLIPYLKKYFQLRKIIKSLSPDIIFSHGEDSELITGFLKNNIKKVNVIHSVTDFPKNFLYRSLLKYYSRKRYSYTLTVSRLLTGIPEKYGIKNSVVQPGIEMRNSIFNQNEKFKKNNLKIGYIGRIVKEKGLRELIKAISILKLTYPKVKLIIAGYGKYLEELKSLSKKLLVEDEIVFLGEVTDPWQFYESVDILVLPSYFEALPLILIEAMAAGTVVVASNVGGISELIIDGHNGILLKQISPDSIAESVSGLIENNELMTKCRDSGYETTKNFSITGMVSSFVDCMRELHIINDVKVQ
jgi:glycosyltransferase involved in cell wall biosynthesis